VTNDYHAPLVAFIYRTGMATEPLARVCDELLAGEDFGAWLCANYGQSSEPTTLLQQASVVERDR